VAAEVVRVAADSQMLAAARRAHPKAPRPQTHNL
jgi:hypothetical protein